MTFWLVRRRGQREEFVRFEPRGYDRTTNLRAEAKQFQTRTAGMAALWAMRDQSSSGDRGTWRLVRVTVREKGTR